MATDAFGHGGRGRRWRCAALAAGVAFAPITGASLEVATPESTLSVVATGAWSVLETSSFTALAWVHPCAVGVGGALLEAGGSLRVELDESGAARATLWDADGDVLTAMAPGAAPADQWSLIAATFERSSRTLTVRRISVDGELRAGSASVTGFVPRAAAGEIRLGARAGVSAMQGVIGAVALRSNALTASDVERLWSDRWFSGIYATWTTGVGGAMNGESGCRWMTGHAVVTDPNNGIDENLEPRVLASVIGEPATTTNLVILDVSAPLQPDNVAVVRPVLEAQGMTHVSPFDVGDFFAPMVVEPTASEYPEWDIVSNIAPKARRLISGPFGVMRVMTSANSRGVRSDDGSGRPGNFAHGFFGVLADRVCGVLNRPASTGPAPWFGFDCTEGEAYYAGNVLDLTAYDFARFWSGSAKQAGIGPGRGLLLRPESVYALRTKPEGLMIAEAPLMLEAYVLRHPGAGVVRWTPTKSALQGEEGVATGLAQEMDLNSTVYSRAFTQGPDLYNPSAARITLDGDCTSEVAVGWAVHVDRRVSVIEAMDFGATTPGKTTLRLEHPFDVSPVDGEMLEFGPWEYVTLESEGAALTPEDPMVWRGLRVESVAPDRNVVLFSFNAWRPGVDGFMFGSSGWGGKGYGPQLEESFSRAASEWVRVIQPDIWLQMFAQQNSPTATMSSYTDMIREGAPDADIVWLGDSAHFNTLELWHRYILQNAAAEGVPAISLLRDPRIGTILDQFADGTRADTSHFSVRGNIRIAEMWLEAMEEAIPASGLLGDINGDGSVDFFDLNYLLSQWGATGEQLAADLNGSGTVDFADLNLLLSEFNQGG